MVLGTFTDSIKLLESQRYLEGKGKLRPKVMGVKRKQRCVREINPLLRHERNTLNYFVLPFIGMFTSYSAACKPWITQRESTMKDKEE